MMRVEAESAEGGFTLDLFQEFPGWTVCHLRG